MMKSNCMGSNPKMKADAGCFNFGNDQMNACFSMMKQMCNPESNETSCCGDRNEQIPNDLAALFNEWYKTLEDEVIKFTKESNEMNVGKIADEFKLSHESVLMLLNSIKHKEKQSSKSQ